MNRRALGLLALAWLLLEIAVILGNPHSAFAASVNSASFTGAADAYTDPVTGILYAKPGSTVTLNVSTTNDTKCIDVRPDNAPRFVRTSPTARSAWEIPMAVPAAGVVSVRVSASPSFNNATSGPCTGPTPGNQNVLLAYVVDNTGPVVTGALTPAANSAGWNNSDVAIAWTATDTGGSGIRSGPTPAVDGVAADTTFAGVSRSSTATDNVGNVGTGAVAVRLDETPPSVDVTRSPAANTFGWNNTDVSVSFACSDALSGIKSCTGGGSTTVTAEGARQAVSGTAVDNADNVDTSAISVSIDKTSPSLSGAAVDAPDGADVVGVRWYRGDVAIAWTASDALSGLDGGTPANGTVTGEGEALFTTASVSDKAGNATHAVSAKVNIDRTAPTTNATAPGGWTNTSQTIRLSPSDNLSGVKATHYKLDGGPQQTGTSVPVSGDGVHTLEYWSVDHAGNPEAHKTVDVKIDGTKPTITHTLHPAPNGNGWNRSDVTVKFLCDDAGGSGIASCTADQVVADEGERTVTGTATDQAGNTATDPAMVRLDETAPGIEATVDRAPNARLAGNGTGWYDADVTVSYSCDDVLSGIDVCAAADTLGEGYDQAASGTAHDLASNSANAGVAKVNVDKTPPTLSGSAPTGPNGKGWYNDDVTIGWSCSDALSGIDGACPADDTIKGEGGDLVASASVSDNAGHETSADSSPAVRIDRTAPSTSVSVPAALDSGWYAGPVQVTLSSVDTLSGVDKTYYEVDGGTAQEYAGPFRHSLKGTHTIRFWSVDDAGNAESKTAPGHSITLKIDDVKPTISGSQFPAANGNGWNNTPVDVSFTCDDAESGVAGCTGATTLNDETTADGTSVTGNTVDVAGNTNEATFGPVRIDLTKPTLSGTPGSADNEFGWYSGDVQIDWTAQDALSTVDAATIPADSVISGEGAGLKAGPKSVKDLAGNESDATYSQAVNIDRTAPTITGKTVADDGTARSANAAGWFNSSVRVRFACADGLSGIAQCAGDQVLDTDGTGLSATGTTEDKAANGASTTVGPIKIDSRAPETSAEVVCTRKNGWCSGTTATVNLTASDPSPSAGVATSGVKEIRYRVNDGSAVTVAGATASVNVPLSGTGTASVEYWSVDHAGNSDDRPLPNKAELSYDTIAPVVSHTLNPLANAAGWNRLDTTVHFSAVDQHDGSGVDSSTITPDVLVDTETAGRVVTGSADDLAGNTGSDSVTVKLDKTKPAITGTPSGTMGAHGWYTSAVTVKYACADPGTVASGIATCSAQQTLGHGDAHTGTAEDRADNKATTSVGPFKVDTDAPAVAVKGVGNGGSYPLGSVPTGACEATDVGPSGIDGTCSFTVGGGQPNGVGTFDYTATARDMAGNVTTVKGSYRVVYDVKQGTAFWLQPINDTAHTQSTTLSVFKAGSTVPAKFRLVDSSGNAIQTNTAPVWLTPVRGSVTTAPVDESVYSLAADSGSAFRWSQTDQHYMFNWATAKSGAGYYWRIGVRLDDGTTQTVNIGLR